MKDFYKLIPSDELLIKNKSKGIIIHPARILIIGGSGTGNTNCLMNVIDDMNCFTKYYIYAKMLGCDPLYDNFVIPQLRKVEKKYKTQLLMAEETSLENLPEIEDLDSTFCKAFIFDDLINCNQKDLKKIAMYFIASRKKNCAVIFIDQDYINIPKIIRTNVTTVVITSKKCNNALMLCLRDISEGNYGEVKELYSKQKNVFIKMVEENFQTKYILDF